MTSISRQLDQNHKDTSLPVHPNPMDRNRSILWARYHIDSDDWLVLATKVTLDPEQEGFALVSMALIDGAGRTVFEALVKPDREVPNDLIAMHALDYAVVFNAQPYPVLRQKLIEHMSEKEVTAWNFDEQRNVLNALDKTFGLPAYEWLGNSVSHQLARFTGVKTDNSEGYELQPLTINGLAARDQCLAVRKSVVDMASSSQAVDSLSGGKPGWTAQFYRPKISPADKLKNLFGRR
ncbi:MAG: hypothetical protein K8F91_20360 [Candidatus Obscuribacterales bacterium]|nr:hypothetical protein [Candidatus Obscuribacterales bacterium]